MRTRLATALASALVVTLLAGGSSVATAGDGPRADGDPRRAPRDDAPAAAITFTRDGTGTVEPTEPFEAPGSIPVVGDFVGDDSDEGRLDDILWYTPGPGGDALWRTRKDRVFAGKPVSVSGTFTPLVGWFGNDHDKQDVLWYAPGSTTDWLWDFDAGGGITQTSLTINGTYTPIVGAFSADQGTEILWYAPGPSADAWWDLNGAGGLTKRALTVSGRYRPVVGSFAGDAGTGDAATDVLWYAPGTGPDALWDFEGDGAGVTKTGLTINGTYTPVPGDFSADGYDDVLWYAPGGAADNRWDFTAAGGIRTTIPEQIDGSFTPVIAELFEQADHRDDILWFGPGATEDAIWDFSTSTAPQSVAVTLTGDRTPAVGAFELVPYAAPGIGTVLGRGGDILDRFG